MSLCVHRLRPDSLRLALLVPDWLADRRADGYRARGVQTYQDRIWRFLDVVGAISVEELTTDMIRHYKTEMSMHCAPGTVRNDLNVLRSFCDWLVDCGYLVSNPARSVAYPRVTDPDPDPLTRAEITQLLTAIDVPQIPRWAWRRNRLAVLVPLYAGLRIAETAALLWSDIDLDRRELQVRTEAGKGGKARSVPICDELASDLHAVTDRRSWRAIVCQRDGRALKVKSLARIYERWLARRGVRLHAHQLRKTFATELYIRGEGLATIQRLLGHADPKTTMRYIGASSEREHAAVQLLRFR